GSEGRDLQAFTDTAAGAEVRLRVVDRAPPQQRLESEARVFAFAAGDCNLRRAFYREIPFEVEWRNRLLEPKDVVLLDTPRQCDGCSRIVGVIGVNHEPDIGPQSVAHRGDQLGVALHAKAYFHLRGPESPLEIELRFTLESALERLG